MAVNVLILIKIRPVGVGLFLVDRRRDGRTDRRAVMRKLIVAFSNFANVPNEHLSMCCMSVVILSAIIFVLNSYTCAY